MMSVHKAVGLNGEVAAMEEIYLGLEREGLVRFSQHAFVHGKL